MQLGKEGAPEYFDHVTKNLFEISRHVEDGGVIDASHLRICKTKDGGYELKTNNKFMQLFYSGSKHKQEVQVLVTQTLRGLQNVVSQDSTTEEQPWYKKQPQLAVAAQRYAQALKAHEDEASKVGKIELKTKDLKLKLDKVPTLKALKLEKVEVGTRDAQNLLDAPVRIEEKSKIGEFIGKILRALGFEAKSFFPQKEKMLGGTEKGHRVRSYATDIGFDHPLEAIRIFFSTQIENIRSLWNKNLDYAQGVDLEKTIYKRDDSPLRIIPSVVPLTKKTPEPSSYWHGHATPELQIPVRSTGDKTKVASIRVIADPVEGHMSALLYRRKTEFMSPLYESPAPHVFILSHPHRDHLSPETVEKLVSLQPVMVVPKEEMERFQQLGFKNVYELDWWQPAKITFEQDGEKYEITIRGAPARHWSEMGPFIGGHSHTSGFQGYTIEGHEDGAIYFAGDTAPLNYKATFKDFDFGQYIKFCENKIEELGEKPSNKADEEEIAYWKQNAKDAAAIQTKLQTPAMQKDLKTLKDFAELDSKLGEKEATLRESKKPHEMADLKQEIEKIKSDMKALIQKRAEATKRIENAAGMPFTSHIQALRARNIAYYFAPGGPDEVREDMQSTHQSSSYGLQGHVDILLNGIDHEKMSKKEFLEVARTKKTVYMHTMTYKLGKLRLLDTPDSLERVLQAVEKIDPKTLNDLHKRLEGKTPKERDNGARQATWSVQPPGIDPNNKEDKKRIGLRSYELDVVVELLKLAENLKFEDQTTLTRKELVLLLRETVVVPKIGSNLGLRTPKSEQQDKTVF